MGPGPGPFWQRDVGRNGFFPFDLMAAAFMLDPGRFQGAALSVWVGRAPLMGPFSARGLCGSPRVGPRYRPLTRLGRASTAPACRVICSALGACCGSTMRCTGNDCSRQGTRTPSGQHVFDLACVSLGIEHRLCPPRHLQTTGMVERCSGRIGDLVNQTRFQSAAELGSALGHCLSIYNHPTPHTAYRIPHTAHRIPHTAHRSVL